MANKTYRLSNQALQDLHDITDHIAADNPSAADRVLDTLLASFELLGENPQAGTLRNDLRPSIRMFVPGPPAGSYVIFYYPISNGIEVSDVIHAKRDWQALFLRKDR